MLHVTNGDAAAHGIRDAGEELLRGIVTLGAMA